MRNILCILVLLLSTMSVKADYYIDGEFNGWQGETVVKLSDGSFWIQTDYSYNYCFGVYPKVKLYNEFGQIKMLVEGCGNAVSVRQITDVIESRIDGEFEGFEGGKIFKLMDGSEWEQTTYKYWYYYSYNPECIVYYDGGWKLQVSGETVEVRKISGGYSYGMFSSQETILRLINNTNETIYSCYTYYNFESDYWESIGWFKLDPYSMIDINLGYYSGYVYIYGEVNSGELWWGDPNSKLYFCIHKNNAFKIANPTTTDCNNLKYKKVQMSEVSVKPGIIKWTFNARN